MLNLNRNPFFVVYVMLFLALSFFGCRKEEGSTTGTQSSGGDSSSGEPSPVTTGEKVSFDFAFSSALIDQSPIGESEKFTVDQVMYGQMTVTNTDDSTSEVHNWTVYFDDTTWAVESNKTLVLSPANYTFVLTLTQNNRVYTGNTAVYIRENEEGTNTVDLIVHPIIGEISTDMINDPSSAPEFAGHITFHYDSTELAGLTSPRLGVIVDTNPEQFVDINPTDGKSTTFPLYYT